MEKKINDLLKNMLETILGILSLFIDQFRMNIDGSEDTDLTIQKDYSTLVECSNKLHEIKKRRF